MPRPPTTRPRKNPVRVLIVVGGLLIAANIWIFAGISQRTNVEPTLPTAITELIPKPGDLISPQSTIGVDLDDSFTGTLELDRVEIPLDQVVNQTSEGIITFSPGPDKELTVLPQGNHTLTVVYWPRNSSRKRSANFYTWSFKVGA